MSCTPQSPGQAVTNYSSSKPPGDDPSIAFSITVEEAEKGVVDKEEVKHGNVTEKKVTKEKNKQSEKQGEEKNSKEKQTDNEKKVIDKEEVKHGNVTKKR